MHHSSYVTEKEVPSDPDIKWKIYRCYMKLKDYQEAIDMLCTIPVNQRSVRVVTALATLYQNYKNDNKSAALCYRQALRMCPFAVEAVLGLLSTGMCLEEVSSLSHLKPVSGQGKHVTSCSWLKGWLEAQSCLAGKDHIGAVMSFQKMRKENFNFSPDMNCDLALCMARLGRRGGAEELFNTARIQDQYTLRHMDTFARISDSAKVQRLSSELLCVSTIHPEPWVAKGWSISRNRDLADRNQAHCFIAKAQSLCFKSTEANFLQASLSFAKHDTKQAIRKYAETIHQDPAFFEAYEALIRCYQVTKSDTEAIEIARMAKQYIKQPAQQLYLEGIAQSSGPSTIQKAKVNLLKAVDLDGQFSDAPLALADIYEREGNMEKAAEVLLKCTERTHCTAGLHTKLGSLLQKLKRYGDAMEHFRLALSKDPTCEKARSGLQCGQNTELLPRGPLELFKDSEALAGGVALHADEEIDGDNDDSFPCMDIGNQGY
eukprot:Em0114g15a